MLLPIDFSKLFEFSTKKPTKFISPIKVLIYSPLAGLSVLLSFITAFLPGITSS